MLVAETVTIEEIISKGGVQIYSDAKSTYVAKIQALSFELSTPGRAYIENGTYTGLDLLIEGPQVVEITNTGITNANVAFKKINELKVRNSRFEDVKWNESQMLRKLHVQDNSILDLKLKPCNTLQELRLVQHGRKRHGFQYFPKQDLSDVFELWNHGTGS